MKSIYNLAEILSNSTNEFLAYNISPNGISKKKYIKIYSNKTQVKNNINSFNQIDLDLLNQVLENKYFHTLFINDYKPYDMSFRYSYNNNSIGFSFIDTQDYIYKSPKDILNDTGSFPTHEFIRTLNIIENNMFKSLPNYNPIFMTGLVLKDNNLESIKAYIRYDLKERPSINEHCNLIEKIIFPFNPTNLDYFSRITRELENLGLIFSFVGVDYDKEKRKRFKLYFRNYDIEILEPIIEILQYLIEDFHLKKNLKYLFDMHKKGLWGIALSSFDFKKIEGIQIYFYS